ncbi:MAG TPA: DNA methyltransferase [Gemmatimonadaceae bacterium]
MPPRIAWRGLLADAHSLEGLPALVRALGFGDPSPLTGGTARALGIPPEFGPAQVAAGPGATRALLVCAPDANTAADQVRRLAARLATRSPHLLWLACVVVPNRRALVLAAWAADRTPPRVAALRIEPERVVASDIETLDALARAAAGNDLLCHARWLEVLGREAISNRFYAALEGHVTELAQRAAVSIPADDAHELALITVSRLLFLGFLEAQGWLDGDPGFLARIFDRCMATGGGFHRRVLWPLFFGTLNTRASRRAAAARAFGRLPFLNGGLFQRSAAERRARRLTLPDEAWGRLFGELLLRYRFTAREAASDWSETAVDPEMLGRAFESLMASRERRDSGAFFTPFGLVEHIMASACDGLFAEMLGEEVVKRAMAGELLTPDLASELRPMLARFRLLDPACGSGAFLVHALERLTMLWRAAGDASPFHLLRRRILTESIFGVDVNPIATWLCELRLWLAVVLDDTTRDPLRVLPLPNLDHNIQCGDSLAGGDFALPAETSGGAALGMLRRRYARATGPRKHTLARLLAREERGRLIAWLDARLAQLAAQRRELLVAARGRDLFGGRRGALAAEQEALRVLRLGTRELRSRRRQVENGGPLPFAFASRFPDVAQAGGFDLVIGNPPWVRLHRIPAGQREQLRREFRVFREAAWEPGLRDARAGSGFAAQVDVAALFVERGLALTRPGGVLAFLVPSKLWRSLAGGGVRRLLHEESTLRVLEDWSDAPAAFDAATYPSLVVAQRTPPAPAAVTRLAVHRGRVSIRWLAPRSCLPLEKSAGAPWLPLPPDARAAFDRLAREGVALVQSGIGHPTLGVKCGCNDAFVVREVEGGHKRITVTDGRRTADVEAAGVWPLLRGETLRPWRAAGGLERIIYPCDDTGRPLARLPEGIRTWLVPWRAALTRRADARGGRAWWALFRTESARHDRPRVVWADVDREPQALVLPAGDRTVALNSCYVLHTRDLTDALTLAALFNSALAAAWLAALAEPARGGYRRYLAWTTARLPLPDDWARAREILAPLAARAWQGDPPSRSDLLDAVLDAWRLRLRTVAPLLEWMRP